MATSDFIAAGALGISGLSFALGRWDRYREGKDRRRERSEDRERYESQLALQRPDLIVQWNWNYGDRGAWIGVNITARPGRPGTSVANVGLTFSAPVTLEPLDDMDDPDLGVATGIAEFPISEEFTVCEPGKTQSFIVALGELPELLDADTELVPYATDVEGERHLGPPDRVVRRLLDEGWRPDPAAPPTFPSMNVEFLTPPSLEGSVRRFRNDDLQGPTMIDPPPRTRPLAAMDAEATPDEVAAVQRAFDDAGFDYEVDAVVFRLSADQLLPWAIFLKTAPALFLAGFTAAMGADAWKGVKTLLGRVRTARGDREGSILIKEDQTGTNVVLSPLMPDEAYRALFEIDWSDAQGAYLVWDEQAGAWRDALPRGR